MRFDSRVQGKSLVKGKQTSIKRSEVSGARNPYVELGWLHDVVYKCHHQVRLSDAQRVNQ